GPRRHRWFATPIAPTPDLWSDQAPAQSRLVAGAMTPVSRRIQTVSWPAPADQKFAREFPQGVAPLLAPYRRDSESHTPPNESFPWQCRPLWRHVFLLFLARCHHQP